MNIGTGVADSAEVSDRTPAVIRQDEEDFSRMAGNRPLGQSRIE